ncbi:MAG: L,D-transpeptidase, partial [bacterium]|nr:L,D-transpeptidase [bacterium]
AGKDNPLGTRWLGVSKPHYGIHGTNLPESIGKRASGGCIRLHNAHVEELFELVEIGDTVEFHGETNERVASLVRLPDPTVSITVELALNHPAPATDAE